MTENLSADQKRNINRKLREVGAAENITTIPFSAEDMQLVVLVDKSGQITTGGKLHPGQLPDALRRLANHLEAALAADGTDAYAPGPAGGGLL